MAVSSNPSPNNHGSTTTTNNNVHNGGRSAVPENPAVGRSHRALSRKVSPSVNWTPDEQSLLEELLAKYASDSTVMRYSKIAVKLNDKTAWEVALRCNMTKKDNGKRRKDDNNSSRKHKDKKEKVTDQQTKPSSHATNRANGPYAQSTVSMDSDDGIFYKAIGDAFGQLLEQNAQALDQISANFSAFKCGHTRDMVSLHGVSLLWQLHENINLFCQTRNNIVAIINDLNEMPEIMKQMPPLPVMLNDELANSILPRSSMPRKS